MPPADTAIVRWERRAIYTDRSLAAFLHPRPLAVPGVASAEGDRGWRGRERQFRQRSLYTAYAPTDAPRGPGRSAWPRAAGSPRGAHPHRGAAPAGGADLARLMAHAAVLPSPVRRHAPRPPDGAPSRAYWQISDADCLIRLDILRAAAPATRLNIPEGMRRRLLQTANRTNGDWPGFQVESDAGSGPSRSQPGGRTRHLASR
jgi:hypothetical protein